MQQNNGNGLSVAGLVLGIIAVLGCWIPYGNTIMLILGIVGIVLAVKGRKQAIAAGAPTGMATAGLVLSIIGTVIAGIGFLSCTLCVVCFSNAVASDSDLADALNSLANELNSLSAII